MGKDHEFNKMYTKYCLGSYKRLETDPLNKQNIYREINKQSMAARQTLTNARNTSIEKTGSHDHTHDHSHR